jgi:hypothetical protein
MLLKMSVDVSIVIVSYNTKALLSSCLQSIYQWAPRLVCEIIVVDNTSSDGSADAVIHEFPSVQLIRNSANEGFAKANNQGIRRAAGKYLLLLNPDTLFVEDALTPLFEFMEQHPEAGMAGCKILNEDGSLQPSFFPFPSLLTVLWTALFLDRLVSLNHVNDRWRLGRKAAQEPFRVQRLLGAFLFVRREVFKQVGLFDEGFFLFSEEEDFCYRAHRKGRAIYYFPDTRIIHLGGKSTERNKSKAVSYANESKVRFFRKHYSKTTQLIFRIIWLFALIVRMPSALKFAAPERKEMIKAHVRSLAVLFQPLQPLITTRVKELHEDIS